MKTQRVCLFWLALSLAPFLTAVSPAAEVPPPVIDSLSTTGSVRNLRFDMYPAAQGYTIYSGTNGTALSPNTNFFLAPYITGYTSITNNTNGVSYVITVTNVAYEWRLTNVTSTSGFYRVGITQMNSSDLLTSTVLNRLAYGPTPDEIERVKAIGPDAFIAEQLNMNGVPETMDNYSVQTVNSGFYAADTNWVPITVTGTLQMVTNIALYLFTTAPGEGYIDDVQLSLARYFQNITTNVANTNVFMTNRVFSHMSPNVLVNGGFESGLAPWQASGWLTNSFVDNSQGHSSGSSLHVVSSGGSSAFAFLGTNWVRQPFTNYYVTTNTWGISVPLRQENGDAATLSYWYLPTPTSRNLRLQLGTNGINSTPGGLSTTPTWVYATATGTANANSRLYMYINGVGDCYVDDVILVAGTNAGVGPNLLQNGSFEGPLSGNWTNSTDFTNSAPSSDFAHSGSGSLHMVASAAGSGNNDSVQQNVSPALVNGQTYTVSYWYVPSAQGRTLTVKLDGNVLQSTPDANTPPTLARKLDTGAAQLTDLRAWFCMHAVQSPRQLFEVLSQFWENHFVTQHTKSTAYFTDSQGYDGTTANILATEWEYREMTKWRNAMLNPNCTFYDLLKISIESPAMIVYLDSVNSKGNGANVANENYARELLELFTMGVDNGYDQNDIVLMSRAWTGWSVDVVDPPNIDNLLAPPSVTFFPGTNSLNKINTYGKWAANFKAASHGTNRGAIFGGKTVPARFGPPWAGMPYQIALPARGQVTNGIQDGYDVIASLASSPFTAEFISVKLCRLFVHDGFPNPTSYSDRPEYAFYDYTNPNRSEEAELVHQCMMAWDNSTPKGNIRAVLNTIFRSDLFRGHAAAAQKVKTPFEFLASSVRALRSSATNGTATSVTDGYTFASPMDRMGTMLLFDRAAPDGYPEQAEPWISSGTLVERIRYTQAYLTSGTGDDAGNHTCDPMGLLIKKLPANKLKDAAAVADYFLGILYPGEGAGNLATYRTAAINYLNTDDAGAASLFTNIGAITAGSAYDVRVRGMVSMLMAYQRFQEQ